MIPGFHPHGLRSNDNVLPCMTAVMPVYNEAATIAEVVGKVLAQRPVQELVIVDDCPQEGTWPVLQKLASKDRRIKLSKHGVNQGKGGCPADGILAGVHAARVDSGCRP